MQRYFAGPGTLYVERYPAPADAPSAVWPFSQALAATISLAELPGGAAYVPELRRRLAALEQCRSGDAYTAYVGAGYPFYDDNEWLGLDLVRAYRLLRDPRLLVRAQQLFSFVTGGWDRSPADVCAGGVFWTRDPANGDRNAVSTANGALLALELFRETHEPSYLHWARTMAAWVTRCLSLPGGLVADHVSVDGRVDTTTWSYNQGAMVAVETGLYAATGRRAYLARAHQLAAAALLRYGADGFAGEPAFFVDVFFRDLARLDAVRPNPLYRQLASSYADRAWTAGRDSTTGLFARDGQASLLDQAAMVEIYAQLARR